MNYLNQIRGFYLRRKLYPLSSSAKTLYYILLEHFIREGFPYSLKIPIKKLKAESGLGKIIVCRARRELIKKGYLYKIKSESAKISAVYGIITIDPSILLSTLSGDKEVIKDELI